MTPLVLNRLERPQVEALLTQRAGAKTLPAEVVQHIVAKTDGVPLYVEELTKMLLASALLREVPYELLQAIAPQDDNALQEGLAQLVAAELLYQRGRPPRAKYIFKHA